MRHDSIIVGGGLAGSALADQLARSGRKVLVLERETRFSDRVRGENMLPWGVAAARRLGLHDDLLAAGAHPAPHFATYAMGMPAPARDMRVTTPGGNAMTNMFHPDLQEAVLKRALASGADIMRGATVLGVDAGAGRPPSVMYEQGGKTHSLSAPMVVGADGRSSRLREWGGFEVQRSPDLLTIAGTLLDNSDVPDDAAHLLMGPGCASFWVPLGGRRARTYFIYPGVGGRRALSGNARIAAFLQAVQAVGIPDAWLAGAAAIGPLAEFNGADRWVESPVRHGVVLVGDAAASSDPSWGSGLSLSLLDVEHLANAIRDNDDLHGALERYGKEHDEYFGALHRVLAWMTELVWTPGPAGDERRARVFPRMGSGEPGFPDATGLGPFGPSDERARRLTLGLD